jgi:hypothetical protein
MPAQKKPAYKANPTLGSQPSYATHGRKTHTAPYPTSTIPQTPNREKEPTPVSITPTTSMSHREKPADQILKVNAEKKHDRVGRQCTEEQRQQLIASIATCS